MVTDRQVQETIARCVSTMVFYHNSERSRPIRERMVAEIQVIAGFIAEWGLEGRKIEGQIIKPLEAELISRYGHEVGPRLVGDFCDALDRRWFEVP